MLVVCYLGSNLSLVERGNIFEMYCEFDTPNAAGERVNILKYSFVLVVLVEGQSLMACTDFIKGISIQIKRNGCRLKSVPANASRIDKTQLEVVEYLISFPDQIT